MIVAQHNIFQNIIESIVINNFMGVDSSHFLKRIEFMKAFIPVLLLTGLLHISCTAQLKPNWVPIPNRSHPDYLYITAVCHDASTISDGKTCALSDASRQIESELGGKATRVPGDFIVEEYSEKRNTSHGEVFDIWLLVAYPRAEIKKAHVRAADRVLLGIYCSSDGDKCPEDLRGRIEQSVTSGGMSPVPSNLDAVSGAFENPSSVVRLACDSGAAHVLLVKFEARPLTRMGDEFYSEARAQYRLIDALDGKVVSSFDTDWVKGGHYSQKDASRKSLDAATEIISRRLSGGVR